MDSEEEELLMLQEQMTRTGSRPAASTTRVSSKKGKEGEKTATSAQDHVPNDVFLPIIGDVIERKTGSSKSAHSWPGTQSALPAAGEAVTRGFPEAAHRSKSRFSFARRIEQKGEVGDVSVGGGFTDDGVSMEENATAILSGMSPDDIESAKAEILSRFSARTVDFLKKRGAKKVVENQEASKSKAVWHPPELQACETTAIERIRFGMNGGVVGFAATSEPIDLSSVVKRDLIRQSEGSVGSTTEGYSIMELCMLARSSDSNQRALGLRFITQFLITCRDQVWGEALGDQCPQNQVTSLSAAIRDCGAEQAPSAVDLGQLTWSALWKHALYNAEIVKLIRYSLDDGSEKVRREASKALAALVGLPDFALQMIRAADANPSIGWPRCQVYYMQKSDVGEWVSLPLDIMDQEREDASERDIARIDPITGLLNMRVLNRISYLLKSGVDDVEAMDLLSTLYYFCLGGAHATDAIVDTPHLLNTLLSYIPHFTDFRKMNAKEMMALTILREVVDASSKKIAASTVDRLANFASKSVLSFNLDETHAEINQAESVLCLWRCLKKMGRIFNVFDDIYGSLCMSMYPSWYELENQKELPLAREAFLAAAECCLSGQISSSCCLSVVKDVHSWVGEGERIVDTALFGQCRNEEFLSMIASILHFLQSCCSSNAIAEEDKAYAMEFFPECIQRVYILVFGTEDQSIMQKKCLLSDAIFDTTSKIAIVVSILQILYIQSIDFDWKVSLTESLVSGMAHLPLLFSPVSDDVDSFDIFQPWDFAKFQQISQFARLFDAVQIGSDVIEVGIQTDINLRLLSRLPPGSEDVGLRLLSHLFSDNIGNHLIQKGVSMVQSSPHFAQGSAITDESIDSLRLEAFANLSRVTGYEVKDVSNWKSLTQVRNYSYECITMRGQGSFFPLQTTWMLTPAHCKTEGSLSHDAFRGILLWILGLEGDEKLCHISPRVKHHAFLSMVFDSDAHRALLLHDQGMQSPASCLLSKYLDDITSRKELCEDSCTWNASNIRKYVEIFASETYGDGFFGAALATLFCSQVTAVDLQEELLSLLKDTMAMHHVPALRKCFGNAHVYLPQLRENSKPLGFLFLLDILTSQSFAKCMTTKSMIVDLVMHNLMLHVERSHDAKKAGQILGRIARFSKANRECALDYFARWNPYTLELEGSVIEWRYAVLEKTLGGSITAL